ncbi:ABC transporter ATP-binding protein, partial [Bacillus cereus]|nr:ABC transporter ATP-binding protein [Bacillus cereus]
IEGQMTYGEFIAFVMLSNVFLGPIKQINSVIETYPKGIAGFRRYLDLLESESDVEDLPGAKAVSHLNGDIQFAGVTFGYENKDKVLRKGDLS